MTASTGDVLGALGAPSGQDASLSLRDANGVKWSFEANSDAGGPALVILKSDVAVFNFGGTSALPVVNDTASVKFQTNYWDNGATSGQATGLYNRIYATGAGGGAIAGRFYTTVSNVAAVDAYGIHSSVSFGATGTVTGLAAGIYANILLPDVTPLAGTLTAINAEIYSDGSTTDPAGATSLSIFRVVNGGNATGGADVDDDCVLFDFSTGWTVATGNMICETAATTGGDWSIKIRLPGGALAYLQASTSVGT